MGRLWRRRAEPWPVLAMLFGIPWALAGGGPGGAIGGQAIGMLICVGGRAWVLRDARARTGNAGGLGRASGVGRT